MCMCTRVKANGQCQVSSLVLKQGPSLNLELANSARLGSPGLCSSAPGGQVHSSMPGFLPSVLKIRPRVSMVMQQTLCHVSHLSSS